MPPDRGPVLFDLDGVLVDSRTPITGSLNRALVEHGLPARPPEELEQFIGPPLAQQLSQTLGERVDSARVAAIVATYREHYAQASLTETELVAGIVPVLAELAVDRRLAVATSKPLRFARPLLVELDLARWFDVICGPGPGVETVPKAETVAAALAELDHPARAVMVGDRSHDVVGAHANELPVIGVTWGIGDRDELESAGADAIVERPEELPRAVDALSERGRHSHASGGRSGRSRGPSRRD